MRDLSLRYIYCTGGLVLKRELTGFVLGVLTGERKREATIGKIVIIVFMVPYENSI